MFGLLAVLILAAIFYRELSLGMILLVVQPLRLDIGALDAELRASGFRPPALYESSKLRLSSLSFMSLFGVQIMVHSELWSQMSADERRDLILWHYASCERYSLASKILGFCNIFAIDRDALHLGASSVNLISCLEKARQLSGPSRQQLSAGLSMLGHSLLRTWPSLEERISRLSAEFQKLRKESASPDL